MYKTNVQLSSVEKVNDFVNAIYDFDFSVDLFSGKYCVNGKSIMGIFSLDLARPIAMEADAPDDRLDAFKTAVSKFEVH